MTEFWPEGLYGVSIGGAFFGESMFTRETDASKVALVALVEHLRKRNFVLLDSQFINDHIRQFGTREIPRVEYLRRLRAAVKAETNFWNGRVGKGVAGAACTIANLSRVTLETSKVPWM